MAVVLRPEQVYLKSGIYNGWSAGNRNMLAVLPTGGGKSVVVSDIVNDADQSGENQAVIAHRTELVSQMSVHVATRNIKHRIIAPRKIVKQIIEEHRDTFNGRSFVAHDARCSVGGVDTILSRKEELKAWASTVNRWTIDEAHHVLAENKWGKCVKLFTNSYGLGVTASPQRADGAGLGAHADGVFHDMVVGATTRELIEKGSLCDYEIVVPSSDYEIDEKKIGKSGDWSREAMRDASRKSSIVGDVVQNYCMYALGKRAICFATDVETANKIAKNFNDFGIKAAALSGETPTDVRREFIKRFKSGQLTVLVNVDLFGEGFDVPAVECVIMARPTASLAVYLQQFGRVLRTMAGKLYGLVIDHVSNVIRHGLPDKDRLWTLDRREKRGKRQPDPEEIPLVVCKKCTRPYERVKPACPRCGHIREVAPAERSNVDFLDGDLILLDRQKLKELREATELSSPASVGQRATYATQNEYAGKAAANRQIEKIASQDRLKAAIAQWAGWERYKGRTDQESYRRFYLATGINVLSALAQSRQDMDKLSDQVEKWNLKNVA